MIQLQRSIVLSSFLLLFSAVSASAFPMYLDAFKADALRNPAVDGCNTCHMSPQGGDARNPFGQAFEAGSFRFTAMLRAQFPDRFVYPTSRNGNLVIHFSDPANQQVVVETAGTRTLVDIAAKAVNGTAAAAPGTAAASAPQVSESAAGNAAATTTQDSIPVDPYAREGAFFGMHVVNLPNGKPQRGGGSVDFVIAHRFVRSVCLDDCTGSEAGASDLFGIDGPAFINFAVRAGITDRISVGFSRTNRARTIEFNSMLNIARQSASMPVTLGLRAGVEGRDNFRERYSPFLQPVIVHTIADRVSFVLAPTFAFNTRDEDSFLPPEFVFGNEHNNTIALGIGAGIRVLPTTSIVGEYIPRLWGFKGELKDRPGVSIGLQKSTFRHTFELVLSRQDPMTTSQVAVQGTDTFHLGFNIYRRIR